jgi:aminoglycoside phosphotransferase (APT) family kinase protein
MHADEVETDAALVWRLLEAQFPHWAGLRVEPVASAGTDNALYRLGDEMVVRLPRIHWAAGQAEKEHRWLAILASFLPLAIPTSLALGMPGEGYPWHWSVHRWLAGENATIAPISDWPQAAADLARFIVALHGIDTTGGPLAGAHSSHRGVPLTARDATTRAAIAALEDTLDTAAATAAWEAALRVPEWRGEPVWVHGDLQAGNLLVTSGRISGVIDFGCLGVGDPACDLAVAWNLLPDHARDAFRSALGVDDATWARGRGWALYTGLIALPYYKDSNPVLAAIAAHSISQVLADHKRGP